jgi:hypothetical protein
LRLVHHELEILSAQLSSSTMGPSRLWEPEVVTNNNREPSPDDLAGAAWWDSLSEPRRADWREIAGSAKPADAWAAYKRRMVPDQPDKLAAR